MCSFDLTGLIKFVVVVGNMLIEFTEFPNLQYILLLVPFVMWVKYVRFLMYGRKLCASNFFFWRNSPQWARASSFLMFLDHTHNDAPQSVGLLWSSDQLVAETST